MVYRLGASVGRIRQSLCRSGHHGRLLFFDHDAAFQGTRSRPHLAERGDQMVAPEAQNPSSEGASLRIVGVSKDFPAPNNPQARVPALDDVSLSLSPGELVSIVGPSGCGKSTLLRLVAGLEAPSSGELWVGNQRITGPNAERGLVFQDPNLFPWLTVRRNIESGLVARRLLHLKRYEVDEFMRLVGLQHFANSFPHHLSGGMAQRVALARALINHPKVWLLDE